jgi:hypothetical protein
MRIKRFNYSSVVATLLVAMGVSSNLNAQSPHDFVCYTSDTIFADSISEPPPIMTQPPLATSCQRQSPQYLDFYRWHTNYIPKDNINPLTIEKKVKMRFVVIEANPLSPTKQNFRPGDETKLYQWVNKLNYFSSNLVPLNKPTLTCDPCHVNDQRIRFELTEIEFVTNAGNFDQVLGSAFVPLGKYRDTILNVYLIAAPNHHHLDTFPDGGHTGKPIYTPGGWVNSIGQRGTGAYHVSNHFVAMQNMYLNAWSKDDANYPPNLTFDQWMDAEALRLLHEFNHAMASHHVMHENCSSTDMSDYLSDVYIGGPITCPTDQNAGQDENDPATNHTNNVMDWKQGFNMTPIQVGRNHRNAYIGTFKNYVYPIHAANTMPWNITRDETWDFAIRMYQDIIVKSGKTLTIKCDVQMPPDGRILVEPGAKLIIDGGIVRSYHKGNRWAGIDMLGNRNLSASQSNQPYVELKNGAIVEQATSGIQNFAWDNGAHGGGIIKATNSHFYNNWRAIELNDYEDYSANINVSGCTFTIDDMSACKAGAPFESQVTSWAVKRGTRFYNNTFKIELDQDAYPQRDRRFGIQTSKTGMSIESNTFDGFSKGVYVSDYAGVADRPVWIYHNTFINTTQGVMVGATSYSNIRNNEISKMYRFTPGGHAGSGAHVGHALGVYLDNTQGSYVGCNNRINGTPEDDGETTPIIGVLANSTASQGATILDNAITRADMGVQAQRRNQNLNITCNNFTLNGTAIMAIPGVGGSLGAALKNQGTNCGVGYLRAGNKFNRGSNGWDIKSSLPMWDYYGFKSDVDQTQEVDNSSGTLTVYTCDFGPTATDPNSQCNKWQNCVYAVPPEVIATHRETLRGFALGGIKYEAEGQSLISDIVKAYYDADDDAGLIEFFEDQGDDNAYRSLIPLYIEAGRYSDIDTPIMRMSIDSIEKVAYKAYYDILAALKQSDRRPNQLTGGERAIVDLLAADDLEVSAYARALLEHGYGEEWDHPVDSEPLSPMNYKIPNYTFVDVMNQSGLRDIAPNPAGNYALVKTHIIQEDAVNKPRLVLRDFTGKVIGSYALDIGDSHTRISTEHLKPGLYVISLMVNERIIENRKLAVVH